MNLAAIKEHSASVPDTALHRWYLVVDGNAHRQDLLQDQPGFCQEGMLSEALFPAIRSTACMIAAQRHPLTEISPNTFTEEADWFAARILVLGVRTFHLDVSLFPMLTLANQRAKKYAQQHKLPFTPAKAQMSLHAKRPSNMLIIDIEQPTPKQDLGLMGNTFFLKNTLNQPQ